MEEVSGQGRTVLFVSHNMQAVQKLCKTGILLNKGGVIANGSIDTVIQKYLDSNTQTKSIFEIGLPPNHENTQGYVIKAQVEDSSGNPLNEIPIGRSWQLRVQFRLNRKVEHFIVGLGIVNQFELPIRTTWAKPADFEKGDYEAVFLCDDIMLASGTYNIIIGLSENKVTFQYVDKDVQIHISEISDLAHEERIVNTEKRAYYKPNESFRF